MKKFCFWSKYIDFSDFTKYWESSVSCQEHHMVLYPLFKKIINVSNLETELVNFGKLNIGCACRFSLGHLVRFPGVCLPGCIDGTASLTNHCRNTEDMLFKAWWRVIARLEVKKAEFHFRKRAPFSVWWKRIKPDRETISCNCQQIGNLTYHSGKLELNC